MDQQHPQMQQQHQQQNGNGFHQHIPSDEDMAGAQPYGFYQEQEPSYNMGYNSDMQPYQQQQVMHPGVPPRGFSDAITLSPNTHADLIICFCFLHRPTLVYELVPGHSIQWPEPHARCPSLPATATRVQLPSAWFFAPAHFCLITPAIPQYV